MADKKNKPEEGTFDHAKEQDAQLRSPNEESNQFTDENGAVIDATPEGVVEVAPVLYEEKPPMNPWTKSYKANFKAE